MASILDTIKSGIAKAGAGTLIRIANISPTIGGGLASRVDYIGRLLGNPLPDVGGTDEARRIAGGKLAERAKTPQEREQLEKKAQEQAGFPSAYGLYLERARQLERMKGVPMSVDPNSVSNLPHERARGANVGDVRDFNGVKFRWNGVVWERISEPIPNQPPPPPSPEQLLSETKQRASELGLQDIVGEEDINKILKDVYERGMGRADAIEKALREAAEQAWQAKKGALERQKGEVGQLAKEQREQAGEQETFYKGQLEQRKTSELEKIGEQRKGQERTYLEMKDDLGASFNDTVRQLQARMRGRGLAESSFMYGEEAKLLRDFNRNLSKLAIHHQDILSNLDMAERETNTAYNNKISELEFETRKALRQIDQWEREQIGKIQDNEAYSLAQKFEKIAEAIRVAENIRMQVDTNYANQKLQWEQWLMNMKVNMAKVANEAAQNRVSNAYKLMDEARKEYTSAKMNLAKWYQDETGKWVLRAPTYTGWITIGGGEEGYTDEEKEAIERSIRRPPDIYQQQLEASGILGGGGSSW